MESKMGRLTSAERRRIFLVKEQARQHMTGSLVSTAAIDLGGECRRQLVEAFLPRW